MSTQTVEPLSEDYVSLNARLNLYKDGKIQFEADHQAARSYFLHHVNEHMRFFHDLRERLDWLVKYGYYEAEFLAKYDWDFIEALHKRAYGKKFRFATFFGAYKFYKSYALREKGGKKRFVERYEDRVVATALYLGDGDEALASSIFEEIISLRFQPATPTFQNSGRSGGGELVSCFLVNTGDDLESITRGWMTAAFLSKRGGGVAFCMTDVRSEGDTLAGIEGLAKGVMPWAKTNETVFSGVDQLGQRPGAGAMYLNVHHPDILAILDSKRPNAAEMVRLQTLSLGVVVPDITMELAERDADLWTFSPYDIKKVYGVPLSQISVTEKYDEIMNNPAIRKVRRGKIRDLFARIAAIQFESGYPYVLFEDAANETNPIKGRISMSNLCVAGDSEILTAGGYRRVSDLYASQEDFDVVVDTRARDMDLSKAGVAVETSTRMFRTAKNAEVFKVTTSEGFSLRATAWHKMYVDRGGIVVKIPLAAVETGDKILVQSASGTFGTTSEVNLAYLAGVIAADGTFADNVGSSGNHNPSVKIDLYGQKAEFADRVQQAIACVLDGREDLLARQSTLTPTFRADASGVDRLTLQSAPLAKVLADKGFTAATKTVVPEFVRRGDRATQVAYLDGLFALDASITGSAAGNISIELGSVDYALLVDVQRMLLNLGIYTRVYAQHITAGQVLMPNGHGGSALYTRQPYWTLRASASTDREALHALVSWRGEHEQRWADLNAARGTKAAYRTHRHRATVIAIEPDGYEDVYDVTVENGHSVIFNGIATGNCSEILQVSTPSVMREDGTYEVIGQDISCNLASLNIAQVMKGGDLAQTVETAIRALTQVSRMTNMVSVPTVKAGNDAGHSVGLGQMNLHGFFGTVGIHYASAPDPETGIRHASPEALDFTSAYFAAVAFHAISTSNKLAVEYGETFEDFQDSTYADGSFFDKYVSRDWLPTTEKVQDLFAQAGITLPTRADWTALRERVMASGLYNRYLLAVPPTGSISYINNATSSIHPITSQIEIREEGKVGRRYYPAYGMTNDNRDYYEDAYQIGPYAIIDVYSAAQEHTDQGLSLTLFFTDQHTTRDINLAQRYAWANNIKTIYYIRVRTSTLDGTVGPECVSCQL